MDMNYWLVFLTAAFALSISPGPDLIYVVSKATAQGTRSGILASAGVSTGAFVHVFAAALGVSAIIAASASAFTVLKLAGACYLFYLGIKAILSGAVGSSKEEMPPVSGWKTYKQGALVDILNPKVSIFFMAFLPQFVRPDYGSTGSQIVYLGTLVILMGLAVEIILVLLAAKTTGIFRKKGKQSQLLDKFLGLVLISLGLRLALSR